MTKGEQQAREELREAKKQIKEQQRELDRKDKALAELAAIATLEKKSATSFRSTRTTDPARTARGGVRTD
jgi:uncharacterized Zn finger protein (UPF0148 family)